MGQAQQEHRAILIVEDDAELRSLAAALFEDEQVDTIACESAEAALAIMLIGGRDVAMIFADIRLPGAMDGVDLGTVAVRLAQSMPHATDTPLRTGAWSAVQSNVTLTIPGAP
jgi:CheY-like chemotaxis protein